MSHREVDSGSLARRIWANDSVKILTVLLVLYACYLLLGAQLGYSLRGQLNSLARLTFLIGVYALLSLALNLHWGYTGLFNIGVVGFMAVALYTMALVSKPAVTGRGAAQISGLGLPIWVGILAGMVAAALLGLVVALPALRLRADYLAITTIAMSEIVRFFFKSSIFQTWTFRPIVIRLGGIKVVLLSRLFGGGLTLGTGGGRGLILNYKDPMRFVFETGAYQWVLATLNPMVKGTNLEPVLDGFTYALVILVLFGSLYYVLLRRIGRSPFGRVLKAIREDEQVANALGKNTARFKIKSFMLGCALMGLGGILWQMRQGAITPSAFRPKVTFYVWVALIIGGAGSNTGSVMGGAIFAAVLFQGPRYVKNVIVQRFAATIPKAPPTIAGALGPLFDPLLLFDTQLLNAVPIAAFLGVVIGIWKASLVARNRHATEVGERVHDLAGTVGQRLRDVAGGGRFEEVGEKYRPTEPASTGDRLLLVAGVVGVLVPWIVLIVAGGDALPFVAYTLGKINSLQLVVMGLVLIWIVLVRPEGMLGHRKEIASSVQLLDAEGNAVRPEGRTAATDGGDEQ